MISCCPLNGQLSCVRKVFGFCCQLNSQLSRVRKVFGFHLLNHTGHASAEDVSSKELSFEDQFEYDNLETDHLLLHEYTVSVIRGEKSLSCFYVGTLNLSILDVCIQRCVTANQTIGANSDIGSNSQHESFKIHCITYYY